jgi:excisionase family DNA binding protein
MSTLALVTPAEAAEILGVSPGRVRQFCREGRIGQEFDGRWVIPRDELDQFAKLPRKHGRPAQSNPSPR